MKKWLIYVVSVFLIFALVVQMGWLEIIGIHRVSFGTGNQKENTSTAMDAKNYASENGVYYRVKAEGQSFYVYKNGDWQKIFWKGVNIGAGEPGLFPGELNISYDDYYRWFGYISEMNANCIRVYTTLQPQFYRALYDFNTQTENPLYLFQGVWLDEDDISTYMDVYAENAKIMNQLLDDAKNCTDVIHGNAVLPDRAGFASGTYLADVSPWFGGWILGIEPDPKFIQNTNVNNPTKNEYDGTYLYTYGSTPFETFYCEVGDQLISYETSAYNLQVPLAVTNWVTTDPLSHPSEPYPDEDLVTFNVESIKSRDAFKSNLFASFHVYPYYPDSMSYQDDYVNYVDSEGKVNTYEAYLKDLRMSITLPLMISEFGVASSRGTTHKSVMNYNQGGVDETEQGGQLSDMFRSIHDTGCAGGIVFAWQDEWFKRTWNNVSFDEADARPMWSNAQTSEQAFGILTFDPGTEKSVCTVDGDDADWRTNTAVAQTDYGTLYSKCDEKYVYFMVKTAGYSFESDTLLIPVDTIPEQGNTVMNSTGAVFDSAADFVISINGAKNSRILVDSYYDSFYYLYGEQYGMIDKIPDIAVKNSGRFEKMLMCYGYEMKIPTTGVNIPFASYETGKLSFGNADPAASDYSSLTDFCYKDGCLEIRIPWQLFNVTDPSSKRIMDDFYTRQSITSTKLENGFKMGLGGYSGSGQAGSISLSGIMDYSTWTMPTYHERLKPAYYVLKTALEELN